MAQARDEAQGTCMQQKQMVAESQARATQLNLQMEGQQRRLEEMQQVAWHQGAQTPGVPVQTMISPATAPPTSFQELSNKDQEKVVEVARVRAELQEQMGRMQADLVAQEALREKVAALERQLKGCLG